MPTPVSVMSILVNFSSADFEKSDVVISIVQPLGVNLIAFDMKFLKIVFNMFLSA